MKNSFENEMFKKNIERLKNITYRISCLYKEEEIDEEYLKMCIDLENEIYCELNITEKNYQKIYQLFHFSLLKSDYPQVVRNDIKTRVSNYICHCAYNLPFTSVKKNYYKREEQNYFTIIEQARMDYYKNYIFLLENSYNTEKGKQERKTLSKMIKAVKYEQKFLEKMDLSKLQNDGRERCLVFNHDKKNIDFGYNYFSSSIIDDCIITCLLYNNNELNKLKNRIDFNIILQDMKAAIYLLNRDEISNLLVSFRNNVIENKTEDTSKSVKSMAQAITEIAFLKAGEKANIKQKK